MFLFRYDPADPVQPAATPPQPVTYQLNMLDPAANRTGKFVAIINSFPSPFAARTISNR